MRKKTLKFDNIVVNKKEFYKYKQPIDLSLVNTNKMVLNILLVIKKMILLKRYVLSCHK